MTSMINDLKNVYSDTYKTGTNRVFTAWHDEDGYHLTAQDDGMPVSYTEEWSTLDALLDSMTSVAPLDDWMSEAEFIDSEMEA